MSIARKPDSDEIRACIINLQQQEWLGARNWWPQFGFHFTDMRNAVNILSRGRLYSRERMRRLGIPFVDGASQEILGRTQTEDQNQVRLYFRPRTPTQYRNEGFRPANQIHELGAHLPVPVFLLFDLVDLLTRAECTFSDSSVAVTMFNRGSDATFLRDLPFRDIYHDTYFPDDPDRKAELKARRHAEILIPNQLDLTGLREIHCRSAAEKDTFLFLLREANVRGWQDQIFSDGKRQLFFKKWTYIDRVSLGKNRIQVRFSPDTETSGPFRFKVAISGVGTHINDEFDVQQHTDHYVWSRRLPKEESRYVCTIHLDSHLAYQSEFIDYDIPF